MPRKIDISQNDNRRNCSICRKGKVTKLGQSNQVL